MDTKMFLKPYQLTLSHLSKQTMNDGFELNLSSYESLQTCFASIWYNFSVNPTISLKDSKEYFFRSCSIPLLHRFFMGKIKIHPFLLHHRKDCDVYIHELTVSVILRKYGQNNLALMTLKAELFIVVKTKVKHSNIRLKLSSIILERGYYLFYQ